MDDEFYMISYQQKEEKQEIQGRYFRWCVNEPFNLCINTLLFSIYKKRLLNFSVLNRFFKMRLSDKPNLL